MHIKDFLREKFTAIGVIKGLGAYLGILGGLHLLFNWLVADSDDGAIVWASTIALGLYAFFGLMNYCLFAQMKMQEEIDRMAHSKSRLERAVLTNRQSSDTGVQS